MATFTFTTAQDLATFIDLCNKHYIREDVECSTKVGEVALAQAWGAPKFYPQVGALTLELPWTIGSHGEFCFHLHQEVQVKYSFAVEYKSSMGHGVALLTVNTGAMAPSIELITFEPSEAFLRLQVGVVESENTWSFWLRAQQILGWVRPASAEEVHDKEDLVFNAGGTMYLNLRDPREEALNLLKM